MPFRSKAQARYMEAHQRELAGQGVDVQEWEQATDFKHLPARSSRKRGASGGGRSPAVRRARKAER